MSFIERTSRKTVIGMIHLPPLPGTPYHEDGSLPRIVESAVASARALDVGGADGCLLQTVDRVYSVRDESDPARVAAMTLIASAVAAATSDEFAVGVHMLRNAVSASLAVAKVVGGHFVRVGAIVGRTMTAHGLVEPDPLRIMEYRRKIGAGSVAIAADIHSMHYRSDDPVKTVDALAKDASFVGADAVVLGVPDPDETLRLIASVRATAPRLPVILAGYTNHDNVATLMQAADGAFVGSCIEAGGWGGVIDEGLVRSYVSIVRSVEGD